MRHLNSMDINSEADEIETLQTDVMRFMAIIAFSLLVIFIPLAKEIRPKSEIKVTARSNLITKVKEKSTLTFKSDRAIRVLLSQNKIAIYLYNTKILQQIVLDGDRFKDISLKSVDLTKNTFYMPLESISGSLYHYIEKNSTNSKVYIKFNDEIHQNIMNTYRNSSHRNYVIDFKGNVT